MRRAILIALAAVAACQQSPERTADDAAATEPATLPPVATSAAPPSSPAPATPVATTSTTAPVAVAGEIPMAFRGRYGLVLADCTAASYRRGDNKGLLTIDARELRFFESIATISRVVESKPERLHALLAFEGEGMEWTRDAVLALSNGGRTLMLSDSGEDGPPTSRRYTRCA